MQALVLTKENTLPDYKSVPQPEPAKGEVLIQLSAAALNHRDVWITQGQYPGIKIPMILGSDGAGMVDEQEVLINPGMEWGDDERSQQQGFHILGLPKEGTFAEYVAVPKTQVYNKPPHLSMQEAAALPLAGVTAYRAVFPKCQLRAGERVIISGIGGGVALLAFQFAIAAGAEVFVTSSSKAKIERAVELGAKGGYLYTDERWHKQFMKDTGGADVVIDSAGGPGFANLVKACKPGARLSFYGGTLGTIPLNPQLVFWKQLKIFGTTMGSDADFAAMLQFVADYKIVPVIDQIFDLQDGQAAFRRMEEGRQFGKLVLQIR